MSEYTDPVSLDKWCKLVDLIISLTQKEKVNWKETPRDDEFLTTHSGISILIRQTTSSRADDDLFVMELRDAEGKVIDSFDDEILDNGSSSHPSYFLRMRDLAYAIRRKASGADKVLDDLLVSLGEEEKDKDHPF